MHTHARQGSAFYDSCHFVPRCNATVINNTTRLALRSKWGVFVKGSEVRQLSRASVAVRALADSQTSQVPRRHSLRREGWAVLWRAGKVGCWLEGRTGRPTLTHRHTGEEKFSGKHLCPAASVKVKCSTLNRAGLGPPDRTSTTSSLVFAN